MEDRQVNINANYLENKKITLALSGGIAALRVPELARQLRRYSANVHAVMSDAAQQVITPLTMEWATGNEVTTSLSGKAQHISLEDLLVVAPATYNTIGKIANGIADTPVTTTAASALGRNIPIVMVPCMHMSMYNSPVLQENIAKLKEHGVTFIEPKFEEGKAKIANNDSIAAQVSRELAQGPLAGKNILLTAGPNHAKIDGVRYIGNISTGTLGLTIADDLYHRGAHVTVVYGPGSAVPAEYLDIIPVQGPYEMLEAVTNALQTKQYDAGIFTAAVLDYAPNKARSEKLRSGGTLDIHLVPTPKIIKEVDAHTSPGFYKVGFKLEVNKTPEELLSIAHAAKLKNNADLVVANDLSQIHNGHHRAYLVTDETTYTTVESKNQIAQALSAHLEQKL